MTEKGRNKNSEPEVYDVCVIGGGAAGMSAAIAAARRGYKVCICDKNKKLCKKLYATGNGRCNLANADVSFTQYHSESIHKDDWLFRCLGAHPNDTLFDFLHSIGIQEHLLNGYYYPKSMQASSVVWALLDEQKALGISAYEDMLITEIRKQKDGFLVSGDSARIACKRVVFACGGRSYASLGGCDVGYKIADALKLPVQKQRPALCGCITKECPEALKGVRVACTACLESYGREKKEAGQDIQRGELQFTEYGLSGIMLFNLSSEIGRRLEQESLVPVTIDFLQDVEEAAFLLRAAQSKHRTVYGFLNAYLPDKLSLYLLTQCRIERKAGMDTMSEAAIRKLYQTCRAWVFHVSALMDYESAQVTAGGIDLDAINPDTMEVKQCPGIYAAGEILDIDGNCGGYNLTFAILSGLRAGEHIIC